MCTFSTHIFMIELFKQQPVVILSFLNQDELSGPCFSIGLKYAKFHSRCMSNSHQLTSETVSTNKRGKISSENRISGYTPCCVYYNSIIHFRILSLRGIISFFYSNLCNGFAKNLQTFLVVYT